MLGGGHAVGHDAGARLITVFIAVEHERADGDGLVHVAARAEVAHRAAVEPAVHGLELVDDLHRAHFRRADERAGGERRGEQIERVAPWREIAIHAAHDVHHVAVALDRAIGIHVHAAGARDAAEIVAREIDQHHVLGVLFRIGAQLRFVRGIDLGISSRARTRAGDRAQLRLALVELHERLGRGARRP